MCDQTAYTDGRRASIPYFTLCIQQNWSVSTDTYRSKETLMTEMVKEINLGKCLMRPASRQHDRCQVCRYTLKQWQRAVKDDPSLREFNCQKKGKDCDPAVRKRGLQVSPAALLGKCQQPHASATLTRGQGSEQEIPQQHKVSMK